MTGVDSEDDGDLISLARQQVGARDLSQISQGMLQQDLDAVRGQVTKEVQRTLDTGTLDLYETDAVYEMAKHLFFLRVADRRRQVAGGSVGGVVPEREIPTGIGRLRRHSFENQTLAHWRDRAVRAYNRITE